MKKKLLNELLQIVGYSSINSQAKIKYSRIQNETTREQIIQMLPALKKVFPNKFIRYPQSISPRFCISTVRKILNYMGYQLIPTTYHIEVNNVQTTSTRYLIERQQHS
jgi:hypothetical protein